MTRFNKPDQTFSQNLGSGALSFTTTMNSKPFKLTQVMLKATQAISETITITLDSGKGSAYDAILVEIDLVSETDYVFRPQGNPDFAAGDEIKVQCTASGGVGTVSGLVKLTEIGG